MGVLLLFPSVALVQAIASQCVAILAQVVQGKGISCILLCWIEVVVPGQVISSDQLVIFEDPFIPGVFKGEVAIFQAPVWRQCGGVRLGHVSIVGWL